VIDFGNGTIFPDAWADGPPDPPEGRTCERCSYEEDEQGYNVAEQYYHERCIGEGGHFWRDDT